MSAASATINPAAFLQSLRARQLSFFAGVPDSLLSSLCWAIEDEVPRELHVSAPNEGAAVAVGVGHYLATSSAPVIYLQNAGLGNVINPIVSLAAREIYRIPMLLIIGWRAELAIDGEIGTQLPDEPQHVAQGRLTLPQLECLRVPFEVVGPGSTAWEGTLNNLIDRMLALETPVALVVRKGTFSSQHRRTDVNPSSFSREAAIARCIEAIPKDTPIVATTGMASRELFELREKRGDLHDRDFLSIGGMGFASQIAAGVSIGLRTRKVVCLDGDGALLMHMGGMSIAGHASNLIHVVLNNQCHESVGGQATGALGLNLSAIARHFGYAHTVRATNAGELASAIASSLSAKGASFIEVIIAPGHRSNLGRPTVSPIDARNAFMRFLRGPARSHNSSLTHVVS